MQKATKDQAVTHPHGSLLITTALVETGVHFYVSDGVQRIDQLTKTFANRDQAAAYYRHVSKAAEQGKRIHQIVWEVQALEEAQNAATGRSTEQVKADLNTDATAYLTAETEVHNRVVQLRAEALAESSESYTQWRARVRKQVVQAAQQASQATPAREGRTVRNTKTRVFLKPLDPAQIRAIHLHRDGVVYAGNGISWLTLRAIVDKNYGAATYMPGRQIIQSVALNQAGLEVAASTEAAA
jgi:hypothetical protein